MRRFAGTSFAILARLGCLQCSGIRGDARGFNARASAFPAMCCANKARRAAKRAWPRGALPFYALNQGAWVSPRKACQFSRMFSHRSRSSQRGILRCSYGQRPECWHGGAAGGAIGNAGKGGGRLVSRRCWCARIAIQVAMAVIRLARALSSIHSSYPITLRRRAAFCVASKARFQAREPATPS